MLYNNLAKDAESRIIIAAHRGEFGGNIPPNTLTSYEIALMHGADMIEVDLNRSSEGTLWIFHPGMEPRHLNFEGRIPDCTDEEIRQLRYVNYDRDATQFGLCTFEEVLEQFRGRCYINVDKFWENPKAISEMIRSKEMTDQIVVKSAPRKELFDLMEECAPDICYLPILGEQDNGIHEELKHRNINYVGAEVCFKTTECETGSTEYIDRLHRDGKLVWANAIIYNYKKQLAAEHSDDTSFTVSHEHGWGWLADRGYDILQTDWTLAMITYLKETGRRYR